MAVGFGRLGLAPAAFWAMTPRELAAALRVLVPERPEPMRRAGLSDLMRRFPDGAG
jgi:uncharacterized phage protein (TIGR02216 family)